MTIRTTDPDDVDPDDPSGLAESAYDRLSAAVAHAGFDFVDGPRQAR